MRDFRHFVENLGLVEHPEGGYYKEVFRASEKLSASSLPPRFGAERNVCTSIYFLLPSHHRSLFHRIKSDELWFFHYGSGLSIYVIENNSIRILKLGDNGLAGEKFQLMIPANCWFGAMVNEADSYALCSCTVAPGFDFADFELAERNQLLRDYPHLETEILLLTRS